MSQWLLICIYSIAIYGLSNMQVFGSGPFRIFERIREWASSVSEHFGTLFSCMMCFPANVGLLFSLFDWFLIPQIAIAPFNVLLAGTGLWWLAVILDCWFTSGIVWLIHNFESFFENIGGGEEENNDDIIDAE